MRPRRGRVRSGASRRRLVDSTRTFFHASARAHAKSIAKRLVVSKVRERAERLGVVLGAVEWHMPIGRRSWLGVEVAGVSRSVRLSHAEIFAWAHGRDDAVELRVREALTGEQQAGVHAASGSERDPLAVAPRRCYAGAMHDSDTTAARRRAS